MREKFLSYMKNGLQKLGGEKKMSKRGRTLHDYAIDYNILFIDLTN